MTPPLTAADAIAAYHRMPLPRTDAERRSAAALLGVDPALVSPRPTRCAAATEILDDPQSELTFDPPELAFLEGVERGLQPLTAPVLERVLRMASWAHEVTLRPKVANRAPPIPQRLGPVRPISPVR